eukprot:276511-Amphidinium_carterae.1
MPTTDLFRCQAGRTHPNLVKGSHTLHKCSKLGYWCECSLMCSMTLMMSESVELEQLLLFEEDVLVELLLLELEVD